MEKVRIRSGGLLKLVLFTIHFDFHTNTTQKKYFTTW